MEEHIGAIWHRFISSKADQRHLTATVKLKDVRRGVGLFFRALGGDGGLQIEAADATSTHHRRNWLQRIAGSNEKIELAWRDEHSLRLPPEIAWFKEASLNRDLYYWLAALASNPMLDRRDWFIVNQQRVIKTLQRFPGLRPRYLRLLDAHIAERPDMGQLPADEQAVEGAIQQALREPGSINELPGAPRDPYPVPLWLHPDPPMPPAPQGAGDNDDDNNNARGGKSKELDDMSRRQAERVEKPDEEGGLVSIRMENILTWGEFANLDRSQDDEEDLDTAEDAARDMDKLSVTRSQRAAKIRLKFDLDLPGEETDVQVLSDGILLPEWDWKKQWLIDDHCRIVEMVAADARAIALPERLTRTAKRLRNQFQALAPARVWHRGQPDGQDIDLDAYLRYAADKEAGYGIGSDDLYRELRSGARDLACLLLADLSLSTDSYLDNDHRVIDVIRDSLYLFAESLHATGDRFSMMGFSSLRRDPIRIHILKQFDEKYQANIRGRIEEIKPGYYTRMGAAIRYGTEKLKNQPAGRRLLLILTDGKPNDLDQYEGRYGVEDTRHAVLDAKRIGLQPFCITIDEKGNDYLPHLFGTGNYVVIRNPTELPKRLPLLYAKLTAS